MAWWCLRCRKPRRAGSEHTFCIGSKHHVLRIKSSVSDFNVYIICFDMPLIRFLQRQGSLLRERARAKGSAAHSWTLPWPWFLYNNSAFRPRFLIVKFAGWISWIQEVLTSLLYALHILQWLLKYLNLDSCDLPQEFWRESLRIQPRSFGLETFQRKQTGRICRRWLTRHSRGEVVVFPLVSITSIRYHLHILTCTHSHKHTFTSAPAFSAGRCDEPSWTYWNSFWK